MAKAQIEAIKLLKLIGWEKPGDLTLEEIAYYLKAIVNDTVMNGSQGRILMDENYAIISINSEIDYLPKRNFVLAHEIGHLRLHNQILPLFSDNESTLNEWYKKGKHEEEANEFASELLMPSNLFDSQVKGRIFDLSMIREVASYFGSSQTATLLKYRKVGDFPISIIFSKDGIVKWKAESDEFPLKYLPKGSKIQNQTAASDFYKNGFLEEEPISLNPVHWFPEDFKIKDYLYDELKEQNFRIGKNGLLTCLWID
ncbi:MAG: ImmA/IrrE family metallo-endopeptidase [Bacteroidota bacterium]